MDQISNWYINHMMFPTAYYCPRIHWIAQDANCGKLSVRASSAIPEFELGLTFVINLRFTSWNLKEIQMKTLLTKVSFFAKNECVPLIENSLIR